HVRLMEQENVNPVCFQPAQRGFCTLAQPSRRKRWQPMLPKTGLPSNSTGYPKHRPHGAPSLDNGVGGNSVFRRNDEAISSVSHEATKRGLRHAITVSWRRIEMHQTEFSRGGEQSMLLPSTKIV